MIYVETGTTKPEWNLAFDEYFLKTETITEPVFMLWQNEPAIVVGRFQNTAQEINQSYTTENNIRVVRRISGGGAVYHDLGNLCYTFILRGIAPETMDFSIFAGPVLKALEKLGVKGEVSGRNDLTIAGRKFSGTAMSLHHDSLLFHGTLLYDSDLTVLSRALRVSADKIQAKGMQSVRSRVTNIKPYTNEEPDIQVFKEALKKAMTEQMDLREYQLQEKDQSQIGRLAADKYCSWDWTYGSDKEAEIHRKKRFAGGSLSVLINLVKGRIRDCRFEGDFLGLCSTTAVERALCGIPYEKRAVEEALQDLDIRKHFGQIERSELVECIMGG